jgi:hypothetical protein
LAIKAAARDRPRQPALEALSLGLANPEKPGIRAHYVRAS